MPPTAIIRRLSAVSGCRFSPWPAHGSTADRRDAAPGRCARHHWRMAASGDRPGWVKNGRAIRAVRQDPGASIDTSRWPATVPAVEQLLCEGLELPPGLTVLVGENGSGKSTVMEILAEACGLNPQGGSTQAKLFRTRDSEPVLGGHLVVERGPARPKWSYFLRADTM